MRVSSLSSKDPFILTGSERLGLSKRKTIRQMPTTLVRRVMVTPEARLELGKWTGFRGYSRLLMDRCELQKRWEIRICVYPCRAKWSCPVERGI